jgi:hypothetical protein
MWDDYSNTSDLTALGVVAGITKYSPVYIGLAPDDSIVKVISTSAYFDSFCYNGPSNCENKFKFLRRNLKEEFMWISSNDGDVVENAVNVNSFFVGRKVVDGFVELGVVVEKVGLVYEPEGSGYKVEKNYEILICKAN